MKTRHVSTGSTASLVNGNSEPSAAAFSQTTKNVSGGRPKKSIMKPSSKLSHDEDEEVSFSDSAPVPPTVCNGTSPSNLSYTNSRPGPACSKVGVRKRKTAAEKFLEDNADYYGIQVLPSKLRNQTYPSSTSSTTNKWHTPNTSRSSHDNPNPERDSFST